MTDNSQLGNYVLTQLHLVTVLAIGWQVLWPSCHDNACHL